MKPDAWSLPAVRALPPTARDEADTAPLLPALHALWRREWRLTLRRRTDSVGVLLFFVLVASLLPLAVGPSPALLEKLAPGAIWIAALLASMLSLPRLFASDHQDGTLELMLIAPHPLGMLVLVKALAHWAGSGLLLVLATPVLALQFGLGPAAAATLCLSLLIGTPVLSLVGAIGSALTVGLRGGGTLITLLVLPLCVPVLVFGAGAVEATQAGMDATPHLCVLGALLLLALPLGPWAAALALRIAND